MERNYTANGALCEATTGAKVVDLYAVIGSSRGKSLGLEVQQAFKENLFIYS